MINTRKGRRVGVHGVTVNVYEQYTKPRISKSFTIQGLSVDELYAKLLFFVKAVEASKNKNVILVVETED